MTLSVYIFFLRLEIELISMQWERRVYHYLHASKMDVRLSRKGSTVPGEAKRETSSPLRSKAKLGSGKMERFGNKTIRKIYATLDY